MKLSKTILVSFSSIALMASPAVSLLAAQDANSIQIKGSDTMVNLGQSWAEEFMMKHEEASIAVTGGGSGTGIASLINGTCDIAEASRSMKQQEKDMAAKNGKDVKEFEVAIDALAVIIHPANPVQNLTVDQLSDIFTGKITNWKEVGGKDLKILVLSRERNSGTHVYFLEHVVRRGNEKGPEQFAPGVLMLPSSQAIIEEVSQSEGAIGYDGLGYVTPKVKIVAVAKTAEEAFVLPSKEAALNKTYPLSRPLYFYAGSEPQGVVKDYIDYAMSETGQEVVETLGFVPLSK